MFLTHALHANLQYQLQEGTGKGVHKQFSGSRNHTLKKTPLTREKYKCTRFVTSTPLSSGSNRFTIDISQDQKGDRLGKLRKEEN